jgi:hypothetical protein
MVQMLVIAVKRFPSGLVESSAEDLRMRFGCVSFYLTVLRSDQLLLANCILLYADGSYFPHAVDRLSV